MNRPEPGKEKAGDANKEQNKTGNGMCRNFTGCHLKVVSFYLPGHCSF